MNNHTTMKVPLPPHKQKAPAKEEDTEQVASFLLSLKHRSVTPEPPLDDSGPTPTTRTPPHPFFTTVNDYGDDRTWEYLMGDSSLVLHKDRQLVPDALFVAMAQMKPCHLTPADRVGCYKTRELGFMGMCCKHCGGQPGFGRYYPNSVRSLAQTTTSQTILKHIATKCRFCPIEIRNAVLQLQQQAQREEAAGGRPRYGSRKIFFQRVWKRLHHLEDDEDADNWTDDYSMESSQESYSKKRPREMHKSHQ